MGRMDHHIPFITKMVTKNVSKPREAGFVIRKPGSSNPAINTKPKIINGSDNAAQSTPTIAAPNSVAWRPMVEAWSKAPVTAPAAAGERTTKKETTAGAAGFQVGKPAKAAKAAIQRAQKTRFGKARPPVAAEGQSYSQHP